MTGHSLPLDTRAEASQTNKKGVKEKAASEHTRCDGAQIKLCSGDPLLRGLHNAWNVFGIIF